nr:protein TIC 56, chloroplastic [Tanacetum cinerariifolium]
MLAGVAAAAYGVHQMTSSHGHGGHNVSHGAHNMMSYKRTNDDYENKADDKLLERSDNRVKETEKEEEIEKMRPNVEIKEKLERTEFIDSYQQFIKMMCEFLEESILGFNKVLDKVDAEAEEKHKRRMASGKKKIKAIKRARRPKRVDPNDDENKDL